MGGPDIRSVVVHALPIGAMVLGFAFAFIEIRMAISIRRRSRNWLRYPGEVIDYVWSGGGEMSTQHWVFRWTDADGVQHTARNRYGVSGGTARRFPFPVEVLVDPDDVRRAQVASGEQSGMVASWLFVVVGTAFLVAGAVVASVAWS